MEKKFYKVYCCFYAVSSEEVIVGEHIGELRLNKRHPRLYFERLKRSCIGFECFNKIMFATEKEAKNQAKMLNDKKISYFEWEKWVLEMMDKTHWLTLQEFQELNLQELREDKDNSDITYEELYNKAIKTLNINENIVDDYRPASPMFIDQLKCQIPKAIIIWLKTGDKIMFINKEE